MIDILVYVFENYLPDACPPASVLAKKLSAAGFEAHDISAALSWLDGLAGERVEPFPVSGSNSIRIYDEREQRCLSVECRGFIAFLENNGAIDPSLRETIIERALALPTDEVSLDRLKVIVLAVIWRFRHEVDALIFEELLAEDCDDEDFTVAEDLIRSRLN